MHTPVLLLDDDDLCVHACPTCDEVQFEGFGVLPDGDVEMLRAAHRGVVWMDGLLVKLDDRRRRIEAGPDDGITDAVGDTRRTRQLARVDRDMDAIRAGREAVRERMRWILAGRPALPPAIDLWDAGA